MLLEGHEDLEEAHLPLAEEAFGEAVGRTDDIAAMAVEDLPEWHKMLDTPHDIVVPAHLGPAPHAEVHAPGITFDDLGTALEPLETREDARDTTEHRHWRIVGMQGQLDAGLLGNGDDRLDEVLVVRPHLVGAVDPAMRVRRIGMKGHVKCGNPRPAASDLEGCPLRAPHAAWHPVVAEDRDARPPDVPDGGLVVLDLPVALGCAEHRTFIEVLGGVLQSFEPQAVTLDVLAQAHEVFVLPAMFPRQAWRVQENTGTPELLGEHHLLVGRLIELPDRDPHVIATRNARHAPWPTTHHDCHQLLSLRALAPDRPPTPPHRRLIYIRFAWPTPSPPLIHIRVAQTRDAMLLAIGGA